MEGPRSSQTSPKRVCRNYDADVKEEHQIPSRMTLPKFYTFGTRMIFEFLPIHEVFLLQRVSKDCQKRVWNSLGTLKELNLVCDGVLKTAVNVNFTRLASVRAGCITSVQDFQRLLSKCTDLPKLVLHCSREITDVVASTPLNLRYLKSDFGLFASISVIRNNFDHLRVLDITTKSTHTINDYNILQLQWPPNLEALYCKYIKMTNTKLLESLFMQCQNLRTLSGILFEGINAFHSVIRYIQRLENLKVVVHRDRNDNAYLFIPTDGPMLKNIKQLSVKITGLRFEPVDLGIGFHCPSLEVLEFNACHLGEYVLDVFRCCLNLKTFIHLEHHSNFPDFVDTLVVRGVVVPQLERVELNHNGDCFSGSEDSFCKLTQLSKFSKVAPNVKSLVIHGAVLLEEMPLLITSHWSLESLEITTSTCLPWNVIQFLCQGDTLPTLKHLKFFGGEIHTWVKKEGCVVSGL